MTFAPKSDFLAVLLQRGFVADCTDYQGLDDALAAGVVPGYIGFDATATSLHVGSLIQIMLLRWLQRTGGKPITLMGGGTTKVGDPTGRDTERSLLTPEGIAANIAGIRKVFAQYLAYGDGPTDAVMLDNAEWLDDLNYLDFLRDVGRHFSVNRMLSFDSVRLRMEREQSLSFLEFNYMILQAYDFRELSRRHGCRLQMGGSDQWGNIVNGIELTRRADRREVFGLTTPLLTTADGRKMGKSQGGAVWLDAGLLSPYGFWQFWRNTADADVERFFKLYTELSVDDCERLGSLGGSEINEAKERLAEEVTALLYGREVAEEATRTARAIFTPKTASITIIGHGASVAAAPQVSGEATSSSGGLPIFSVTAAQVEAGVSTITLFLITGLAKSGKDARRLFADGGARINDVVEREPRLLTMAELNSGLRLTAGRKRHALVRIG